jgi:para-nitrobenzyl esterase
MDGGILPAHPFADGGATADVPIIVGTNRDEGQVTLLVGPDEFKASNREEMLGKAKVLAGEKGVAVAEMYLKKHPNASFEDALVAASTENRQRAAAHTLADRKVAQGKAPIFMYRMDWQSPVVFRERKVRAAHGVELSLPGGHDESRTASSRVSRGRRAQRPGACFLPVLYRHV